MTATTDFNTTPERNILERLGNSFFSFFEEYSPDSNYLGFSLDFMGGVAGFCAGSWYGGYPGAFLLFQLNNPYLGAPLMLVGLFGGAAGGFLAGVTTTVAARAAAYAAFAEAKHQVKNGVTLRSAAYAVLAEAGHQVKSGAAFTYGFLKSSVKSLAQIFELVKDKMKPGAAQEVQENIDYLNEALREFKDDAVMMVALKECKTLTAEEYKSIRNNYDHLFEEQRINLELKKMLSLCSKSCQKEKLCKSLRMVKKYLSN